MDFQAFWLEACHFFFNLTRCCFFFKTLSRDSVPSCSMGTSAGYLMLAVVSSRMILRPLALHWVKHYNSWVAPLYLSCSHRRGWWNWDSGHEVKLLAKRQNLWQVIDVWRFWDGLTVDAYPKWIKLTFQIGSHKAIPPLHRSDQGSDRGCKSCSKRSHLCRTQLFTGTVHRVV